MSLLCIFPSIYISPSKLWYPREDESSFDVDSKPMDDGVNYDELKPSLTDLMESLNAALKNGGVGELLAQNNAHF